MAYRQDVEGCFGGHGGLTPGDLDAMLSDLQAVLAALRAVEREGALGWLRQAGRSDDMAEMEEVARRHRAAFDQVVILGTGGSSLGAQALYGLCDVGFGPLRGGPRLLFCDNVDPGVLGEMLERLDLGNTGFIAISKSGGTAETMSQLLAVLAALGRSVGRGEIARHVIAVTQPGDSVLRRIADQHQIRVLEHPADVGGRFSVLTLVGLLPALIAGLDVAAVRQGAQRVLNAALTADDPGSTPAAVGAAVSVALYRKAGVHTTVLMPYADRLNMFALWYRQLWAESLGKDGLGTNPVWARGAVDQHSQLQLYLDGPADKMFTIVEPDWRGQGPRIPRELATDGALDWLAGRTVGDLFAVEADATARALIERGRPVRRIRVPRLDEDGLGGLMMHFMLETVLAAGLLGVDPYDQPAVELGKVLAREALAGMEPGDG